MVYVKTVDGPPRERARHASDKVSAASRWRETSNGFAYVHDGWFCSAGTNRSLVIDTGSRPRGVSDGTPGPQRTLLPTNRATSRRRSRAGRIVLTRPSRTIPARARCARQDPARADPVAGGKRLYFTLAASPRGGAGHARKGRGLRSRWAPSPTVRRFHGDGRGAERSCPGPRRIGIPEVSSGGCRHGDRGGKCHKGSPTPTTATCRRRQRGRQ